MFVALTCNGFAGSFWQRETPTASTSGNDDFANM
jgi:hypothetical protein